MMRRMDSNNNIDNGWLSRMKKFQICLVVSAIMVLFSMEHQMITTSNDEVHRPEDVDVKIKNSTTMKGAQSSAASSASSEESSKSSSADNAATPPHDDGDGDDDDNDNDNNNISNKPDAVVPPSTPTTDVKPSLRPVQPPPPPTPPPVTEEDGVVKEKTPTTALIPNDEKTTPIQSRPSSTTTTKTTTPNIIKINQNSSTAFVEQYCDIAPLKEWIPNMNDPEHGWELRAPYVIFAGVWNAGIRDVQNQLLLLNSQNQNQHNQQNQQKDHHLLKLTEKDGGFFLPKQFYKFQIRSKTKVYAARQRMYAQLYNTKLLKEQQQQQNQNQDDQDANANAVIDSNDNADTVNDNQNFYYDYYIDVSPGYLFYPQTIYPILCTVPWTKFIIVLRNPIQRLIKQWLYSKQNLNLQLSLEDWIAREMKVMQTVGLVGSNEEDEKLAWKQYQSKLTSISTGGAIGRSMYVLQLQEWFDAINEAGLNPRDVVYIVPCEKLFTISYDDDGDGVGTSTAPISETEFNKIFDFLNLPSSHNNNNNNNNDDLSTTTTNNENNIGGGGGGGGNNNNSSRSSGSVKIKDETKKLLQDFFQPYNERLATLLGNDYGNYDWNNIWK